MLPIKSKDSLAWVMEQAAEIENVMKMLNRRLESLTNSFNEEIQSNCSHQEQRLSAEDSDRDRKSVV